MRNASLHAALRDFALEAEPFAPERAHVLDQRKQRAALRRKHVLDARRHLGVGLPRDDTLLLERLQPERERPRADALERTLELTEAAAAGGEVPDDQDRPLAAHDLGSGADGAGCFLRGRGHCDSTHRVPQGFTK
jgi:hypothetical protein